MLDDLFCSLGGLFYRLYAVCCVLVPFALGLFCVNFVVWSVHIIDNREQW